MMRTDQVNAFQVQLNPAGYVHVRWRLGHAVSETDAHAVLEAITGLTRATVPLPALLIDMGAPLSISAGARTAFLTARGVSRVALLGSSPMDRVLAAFALNSATPTRFFLTKTEAITWLSAS
jgi:hypothetical protein